MQGLGNINRWSCVETVYKPPCPGPTPVQGTDRHSQSGPLSLLWHFPTIECIFRLHLFHEGPELMRIMLSPQPVMMWILSDSYIRSSEAVSVKNQHKMDFVMSAVPSQSCLKLSFLFSFPTAFFVTITQVTSQITITQSQIRSSNCEAQARVRQG